MNVTHQKRCYLSRTALDFTGEQGLLTESSTMCPSMIQCQNWTSTIYTGTFAVCKVEEKEMIRNIGPCLPCGRRSSSFDQKLHQPRILSHGVSHAAALDPPLLHPDTIRYISILRKGKKQSHGDQENRRRKRTKMSFSK